MKTITKNSKLLLFGQSFSCMGDYCALPVFLILSTYYDQPWMTSGVIIVRSFPMIIQPFLGGLIDRFDRLKIMIWTDIIRGFIFLGVAFLPEGENGLLFLLLLLISYGSGAFFNPARLSVMSRLGDEIKVVNTLFAKITTICVILGAIVGGVFHLLDFLSLAIVFNAITYFVSAFLISKMDISSKHNKTLKNNNKKVRTLFKEGIKEIKTNQFVLNGVFTMVLMSVACGMIYSYFPVVSEQVGDGEIGNFILTLSIGMGGFIGASLVNRWGFNNNNGLMYLIVLILISTSIYMLSSNFIISFIAANAFFVATEYGEILSKVRIQENTQNEIQGRIFAVSESLIGISLAVGSILVNFINIGVILFVIILLFFALYWHSKLVNKLYDDDFQEISR